MKKLLQLIYEGTSKIPTKKKNKNKKHFSLWRSRNTRAFMLETNDSGLEVWLSGIALAYQKHGLRFQYLAPQKRNKMKT